MQPLFSLLHALGDRPVHLVITPTAPVDPTTASLSGGGLDALFDGQDYVVGPPPNTLFQVSQR